MPYCAYPDARVGIKVLHIYTYKRLKYTFIVRFTVLPTILQKEKAARAIVIDLRFSSPVLLYIQCHMYMYIIIIIIAP